MSIQLFNYTPRTEIERRSYIKKLGDESEVNENITIPFIVDLYAENSWFVDSTSSGRGDYLARILQNALQNSFRTSSRETYKRTMEILESPHKIAGLLRGKFGWMTRDYFDFIPQFLLTDQPSENAVFLRELVQHLENISRKGTKISVLKELLKRVELLSQNTLCDKKIDDVSFVYDGSEGLKKIEYEQHIKPFVEFAMADRLPEGVKHERTKTTYKLFYEKKNILITVLFSDYGLQYMTLPDKRKVPLGAFERYGRFEKTVTDKLRAAFLVS